MLIAFLCSPCGLSFRRIQSQDDADDSVQSVESRSPKSKHGTSNLVTKSALPSDRISDYARVRVRPRRTPTPNDERFAKLEEMIIMQTRLEQAKQKEKERARAVKDWERQKREEEEKEEVVRRAFEESFERKAREKERELDAQMRTRLGKFGFRADQIEAMLSKEEQTELS